MSQKKLSKPAAWKNTYFWIAGLLFIIAIYGLPFLGGENTIRDPGQRQESGLVWFYFGASILMLVNGVMSHRQTVRHYEETVGPTAPAAREGTGRKRRGRKNQMVKCTSCGKTIEKIPDWMNAVTVEFVCNNCPNRHTKNIAFINLEPDAPLTSKAMDDEPAVEDMPDEEPEPDAEEA